jgi:hypothetical protein
MKKQKSGSEFNKWFRAQAGKPIMSDEEYYTLRDETIPALQRQLSIAKSNLTTMERYHVARQYALYAWTAKDK